MPPVLPVFRPMSWHRHRPAVLLLCLSASLCGCVNQLAQRQALLDQFVGHPESELVQKLGVPARSITTAGVTYLAYDDSRVAWVPPLPGFGPYGWWYYGPPSGAPPGAIVQRCEATFTVADGVVKSYTLRGNACG